MHVHAALILACAAASAWIGACVSEPPPLMVEPAGSGTASSEALPTPVLPPMASAASAPPAWLAELPKTPSSLTVGSSAWATTPQPGSELVMVAVYRVDAVGDGVVSLVDKMGQRVDSVPAALVHPIGETRHLPEGTLALFYTWTTPGWLGRVSRAQRGEELKVAFDWAGTTRQTSVDHAEPVRTGIQPLAYVAFPKSGGTSMGLIVALDATRAFVLTGSGHIEAHRRAVVGSIALEPRGFTVGRSVRAYRWATGFERGRITQVLEPGLRYEVELEGNRPRASYFLTTLLAGP